MPNHLVALGADYSQPNVIGAFEAGVQGRQTEQNNQIELARKGLENIGSIALGAMGGKLDGQADPKLYEQGLDMLAAQGINVDAFRGKPQIAPLVAKASMTALQQLQNARDDAQLGLAMKEFQFRLSQAAKADQRAAAAAVAPDFKTIESGGDIYRYNANDPNSKPELWFDAPQGQAPADLSLNPVYGRDANGNVTMMQVGKNGVAVPTQLPEGVSAISPFDMAAGKTSATADAKTAAEARAALPGAEQAAQIANQAIDLVVNDQAGLNEQFGNIAGLPQRNLPVIPGTSLGNWQANFQQAKGQSFMQARQMLKGGGPITDFEGKKADAAYSRMEAAAALGDKQTFLQAAEDFRTAVNDGLAKLQKTADGGYGQDGGANGGGAGAADPLGIR